MEFEEDDETFSYDFHPKDSRWKVKINKDEMNEDETLKEVEDKKKKSAKKKESKSVTAKKESKKPVKKKEAKASKKAEASFTIAEDSDMEDDIVLADLKPRNESTAQKDEVGALPNVTPAEKAGHKVPEIKFKPIDLGLIDKKDSKPSNSQVAKKAPPAKPSTSGGDAIFVNKPKPTYTSFRSTNHYSAVAASSTAATSKLLASKKNVTIPASQFHKSTVKKSNPFQLSQITASKSTFSANVKGAFKKVSSQIVKRSKESEAALAAAKARKAEPKTAGALNVMTGLYRPTQMTQPGASKPRPKTEIEKQYERDSKKADSFMLSMTDKKPEEEESKQPFCTSSPETSSDPE